MNDLFAPPTDEERAAAAAAAQPPPVEAAAGAKPSGFEPPTPAELEEVRQAAAHDGDYAAQVADALKTGGRAALSGIAKASRFVDSYTGSPVRAGVGAVQDSGDLSDFPAAAWRQFGADPAAAPTGKELAAKAGLSTAESYRVPLITEPWAEGESKYEHVSPAGVAGGLADAALDPTAYLSVGAAAAGAKQAMRGAKAGSVMLGEHLARLAEERAAKAATGQNIAALRRLARVTAAGSKDAERVMGRVRDTGRQLLDEGVVSFGNRVENVAPKATEALRKAGEDIGKVETHIDTARPNGSVSGPAIANAIVDYALTIPETTGGQALQDRLLAEAQALHRMGNMTFEKAKEVKNQFKFKAQDQDLLVSNQDVTNTLGRIIGDEMSTTTERLASTVDPNLARDYADAKRRYSIHTDAATAANDRVLKNLSNRFISPSDYGAGGFAAAAAGGITQDPITTAVVTGAVGLGNKVLRERGSASAAAVANALSKVLTKYPQRFAKWSPVFDAAAQTGAGAIALRHHLLMNSDPQYRQAILGAQTP